MAPDDPAAKIPAWFIQDWGIYQEHTEDTRIDGRVVLQWRPSETLMVTVDDNFSRDRLEQDQYGYSVWFNAGNMQNIRLNQNGTVTDFTQPVTPTDFQGQINASKIRNNITGLNLKWDATDKQSFEFDAAYAVAELNPNGEISQLDMDVGYGPSGNNTAGTNGTTLGITGIGSGGLPYPTGFGPNGNASRFINNGIIGSHVLPIVSTQNKDIVRQFKLMGTWKEDNLRLTYDLQYVTDHQDLKAFDTFQNNDWQLFAGYGPASGNTGGFALPQDLFAILQHRALHQRLQQQRQDAAAGARVRPDRGHELSDENHGQDTRSGVQPELSGRRGKDHRTVRESRDGSEDQRDASAHQSGLARRALSAELQRPAGSAILR